MDVLSSAEINLSHVYAARARIQGHVCRTPLRLAPALSELVGVEVRLKLDCMQDTGAFKIRGAMNSLLSLDPTQAERGVICVSTGNHGRAVAYGAKKLGIPAIIGITPHVPPIKVRAMESLGADVRILGDDQEAAQHAADQLIEEEGYTEIHPFDHAATIAGQGTLGLEVIEDMPDLDTLICPLSGGGLLGGTSLAVKTLSPRSWVTGVSQARGPGMIDSIRFGRPVSVPETPTLADSLAGGIGLNNRHSFQLVRDYVDDFVTVTESQIADAMAWLYRHERIIAEGGAAVGVAAVLNDLAGTLGPKTTIVISGGNVDMDKFTRIVEGWRPED